MFFVDLDRILVKESLCRLRQNFQIEVESHYRLLLVRGFLSLCLDFYALNLVKKLLEKLFKAQLFVKSADSKHKAVLVVSEIRRKLSAVESDLDVSAQLGSVNFIVSVEADGTLAKSFDLSVV